MSQKTNLHQESTGEGPALVVLHGLFGDADNFRSIALHLERYYRVIRLDLPGHGHSSNLNQYSFDEMASAVVSHLIAEGITSCHLLGHSLGGKVAMQIAGNASNLDIKKCVIVDIAPRLYPPHHNSILTALTELPLHEITKRSDAEKQLKDPIPDAGIRGFLLKSLYRNDDNAYTWRFDLTGLKADYEHIRQPPTFSQVVACPTLFIKGGNSDYLGPQDELPIRSHFKEPLFKEIGGTGHWPHAEKPALFARLCIEFLGH